MMKSEKKEHKQIERRGIGVVLKRFLKILIIVLKGRKIIEIRQLNATECGAACLAMILNYYGRKTSIAEVREHCGPGRDGLSALTIVQAARDYGLRVRAVSLKENDFRFIKLPAIIHWQFSHFLIVERWSTKHVDIVDPANGRWRLDTDEFDTSFTGIVIMLEPGIQFSRQSSFTQLSLLSYLKRMFQAPGIIFQLIVASLMLQQLDLVMPILTKIIVDQIIPSGMISVMSLLGIGLLVLVLTQMLITLLRSSLLIYLQAHIDSQMMLHFFEHLLSLPYRFFQQRLSGDLLARVNSNTVIRDILSSQLVSAVLDGSLVSIYLFILLLQSPLFGVLAFAIGLLQILILLITTRPIRALAQRDLAAQGKAQGYMNEALAGIATLKSAGAEARALTRWTNLFFDQLNISVRRNYLSSLLETTMGTLRSFAPLALLWVGTMQVLNGSMSVGTMLALNSLATAFLTPLASVVSNGQKLQLVRAHFERIADVIGTEPEQNLQNVQQPPELRGNIELKNVSFRYASDGEMVLRNITIQIKPGQKIALVGHTGSGKSTLGKLLLGLYTPSEGEIFYDGLPLQSLNYRAVRSQLGVVSQDSFIFSGSIKQNIAFNNPNMTIKQIMQAAQMAAIHNDIVQMPM